MKESSITLSSSNSRSSDVIMRNHDKLIWSFFYAYYYKRTTSSNWISIGTEFGTATSASFTPSSAGSFDLMVKVMDGSGQTVTKTFAATAK